MESNLQMPADHNVVEGFFRAFDRQLKKEGKQVLSHMLVPQSARDNATNIAHAVDRFFSQSQNPTIPALLEFLTDKHGLKIKSHHEISGFYALIHSFTDTPKPKGTFHLIFSVIPKGHTAPSHLHQDGGINMGELTSTIRGTLRNITQDGGILSHRKEHMPQISEPNSYGIYMPQIENWIGFSIQPEPAIMDDRVVREQMKRIEKLIKRQSRVNKE